MFISLANIPKDEPIILGALERFYMLPMVFIALFVGLGVYYLRQRMFLLCKNHRKKGIFLETLFGVLITSGVLLNVPHIKQLNSSIFYNYGINVFNSLEKNAVLLTQGDTPTHVLYYLQQVEGLRKDVTILVKNHFTALWYWHHVKKIYPWINPPQGAVHDRAIAIKQVILLNMKDRPLYDTDFITAVPEPTADYQFISMGIVTKVVNKTVTFNEQELQHIKSLWGIYHLTDVIPSFQAHSLEKEIVNLYASYHFQFANQYLQMGLHEDAIREYDKAIHLDATMAGAYKNTAIIYAHFKHEPKLAMQYFNKYMTLEPGDADPAMLSFMKEHSKEPT